MSNPGWEGENPGFKALVSSYPIETIEVVVPELLAERGTPVSAALLPQQPPLHDEGDPRRYLKVVLLATWSDGSQVVILLVEHSSQARTIDLLQVNWCVAYLAMRHQSAVICPVVVVTDPDIQDVPDRWEMTTIGMTVLVLQLRVYRVTAVELVRLKALKNRVAAVLTILARRDAVDVVVAALVHMSRSPGPLDDLERFLPLAVQCAGMPVSDMLRLRRRLAEAGLSM